MLPRSFLLRINILHSQKAHGLVYRNMLASQCLQYRLHVNCIANSSLQQIEDLKGPRERSLERNFCFLRRLGRAHVYSLTRKKEPISTKSRLKLEMICFPSSILHSGYKSIHHHKIDIRPIKTWPDGIRSTLFVKEAGWWLGIWQCRSI